MTRESIGAPRIVAQSNVLNRMTGPQPGNQPKIPEADWPNDEYFEPTKDFFFNGEAVVVYHVPARPHRRRQPGVLPPLRRAQHRRRLHARHAIRSSTWTAAAACKAKSTR